MSRRLRGDGGQVAGIEAIPFGLLVLLVGVLVVAHTWAVVDAKFVAARAAREATRAHVEADGAGEATTAARVAALGAVGRAGRSPASATVRRLGPTGFRRCAPAGYAVGLRVPGIRLPWRPSRPSVDVEGRHQEVVDPYRDGLEGTASCP